MDEHSKRRKISNHAVDTGEFDPSQAEDFDSAEAERLALIAKRAEERAAQKLARDKERNSKPKSLEEMVEEKKEAELQQKKLTYLTKKQREALALERLQAKRKKQTQDICESDKPGWRDRDSLDFSRGRSRDRYRDRDGFDRKRSDSRGRNERDRHRNDRNRTRDEKLRQTTDSPRKSERNGGEDMSTNDEKTLRAIKDQYLGKKVRKKKVIKASEKFSKIFQFDWDASEDTSTELNPIYNNRTHANLLFGRGYRAGVDLRKQRQDNKFLEKLAEHRLLEQKRADTKNLSLSSTELKKREMAREEMIRNMKKKEGQVLEDMKKQEKKIMGVHWSEKTREEMTERDWRIFREDFDITLKGGRAANPLRSWDDCEGILLPSVLEAVRDLKFERPSPIQMQAVPIGLEGKDLIGIAETGSGKTAAFVIPIIQYIASLPPSKIQDCPEKGPLALIMAPTRELASQIEQECIKLVKFTKVGLEKRPMKTCVVVGGQPIEEQAFKLRNGVEMVIGTPGRLMECLETRYLVLNQCNYIVLDEADRMMDMGFEPQVVTVMDSMGGEMKSTNEAELEQQLKVNKQFRITNMFSATMPLEVERLAKNYLRLPAIVKIGDEDSGKNKRIDQQVIFTNAAKKKDKLVNILSTILSSKSSKDSTKIIVFVNIRKECDVVSRFVSKNGFRPTVLHGGKTQDQREESLEGFRSGKYDILVATDVAGRGLDIPDVTHVVNYDLPSKIEPYSHRIGRTGRAGKEGIAISLLTDNDQDIMYDLKQYLISTDMKVPTELANHPSAKAPVGTRDDRGQLISKSKRNTVIFTN